MAQNATADASAVRKETDAQIFTVEDSCDKPAYRAALEAAAKENGENPNRAGKHYTFEICREFAGSTMIAVWDTRE